MRFILFGPTLLPFSVFVVVSLIFYRFKLSPARWALGSLRVFTLPNAQSALQAAAAAKASAQPTGNAKKKKQQAAPDVAAGVLQLAVADLKPGLLERLEFYEHVDMLCSALAVMGITLAVQMGLEHTGIMAVPLNRTCLAQMLPILFGGVVVALVHSEILHGSIPRDDKIIACLMGAFAGTGALALLGAIRPRPLAFDLPAAAAEVRSRWAPMLQSHFGVSTELTSAIVGRVAGPLDAPGLAIGLALVAGVTAAVLLGPAWRVGRLMAALAAPRPFEEGYARVGVIARVAARVGFVLNLLVFALWINPLVSVLPLDAAALRLVRVGALLAAAFANLAAFPGLVQAYLNHGFTGWYIIRHSSGDEATKVRAADKQTRLVLVMAGKVALQLLALPALQAAVAGLLLLHATPSRAAHAAAASAAAHAEALAAAGAADAAAAGAAGNAGGSLSLRDELRRFIPELAGPPKTVADATAASEAAAWLAKPSDLFEAGAGFLGWWATGVWCVLSAGAIALARIGVTTTGTVV